MGINYYKNLCRSLLTSITNCSALFTSILLCYLLGISKLNLKVLNISRPRYRLSFLNVSIFLKNNVISPIIEEIIFRGCLMRLLLNARFSKITCVIISTLAFSTSHLLTRTDIQNIIYQRNIIVLYENIFTFFYTSLFGAYSAALILITGNLASCICAHSICNLLATHYFETLLNNNKKAVAFPLFASGFIVFVAMIF